MSGPILRLGVEELWSALEEVDPVTLLAAALLDDTPSARPAALSTWRGDRPGDGAVSGESVLFEDPASGRRCLLPARELRAARKGALVAVVARELLDSCTVTVGVLGSGRDTQGQVLVVARRLRNISHLATPAADGRTESSFEQWMLDRLDLSGIELDVVPDAADAVFGANLVLIAEPPTHGLEFEHLARGNVLVNTSGQPLPAGIVRRADRVYVDDARLLAGHPWCSAEHRPAGSGTRRCGRAGDDRRRYVDADLRQMLSARHPSPVQPDEIALVEILHSGPTSPLDVALAASVVASVVPGRDT